MQENTTVETKVEEAVTQPETVAAPSATEVDYEALLAEKDAKIAKVTANMENYKKGLLQAKGKIPASTHLDDDETEDMETLVDRKVTEKLLATESAQLQAEKEAILKAALKRNKELEIALKNRGQITSNSADGSNQDKPEGKKDNYFSNDQISALRAKGYDDKKIELLKKNMTRVNEMPK